MRSANWRCLLLFSILISLLVVILPADVVARSGCCAWHGGVCSYQCWHGGIGYKCCDGTFLSSTCDPYYAECDEYTNPQVTTDAVTSITADSVTLNGNLDSTGAPVTLEPEHSGLINCQVWFEYGKTTAYGYSTPKQSTSYPCSFSANIQDLDSDTTYHFRAVASNGLGTVYGSDTIFMTEDSSTNWIPIADAPFSGGYGEAVIGTEDYIYIARCYNINSDPYFVRYNPSTDTWSYISVQGLPDGAFRNGLSLEWDRGDYIYALFGGRYSEDDNTRCLFYRYNIPGDSWEQLNDTPHAQGAGDALTWSEYDGNLYAFVGNSERGSVFARYNASTDTWVNLSLNPSWSATDDGASLVAIGGDIYALKGEVDETVPNGDFARYNITTDTWVNLPDIPETGGVGDGASLLYIGDRVEGHDDHIFALGGGEADEDPGYNFYGYNTSQSQWNELGSIPCPVGQYVGNRLAFADDRIYYWQGSPSRWDCGGDAFYAFEISPYNASDICEWILSLGGPDYIGTSELDLLLFAYLGYVDIGFIPTTAEIAGCTKYYLGYDGDSMTGCSFYCTTGDINSDGKVRISDVHLLLNYLGDPTLHQINKTRGDVNSDNAINMGDVILLLNHMGDPVKYPLGC